MKKNNNVYKPRYKVAFQAKSKIWAYKNSHLRHFYSIRNKRLYRDGFFRKNVLVATTMKWTIARRFIKPSSRRVRPRRSNSQYKNRFNLKQQVRKFYGKLTEVAFRSFYKVHLLNTYTRNKSFFGALEQRADMFLFRLRLLPTIFACNQFIHHQGLFLNRKRIEKCPSALIKIGYTVSLPKIYWRSMSNYMIYRLYFRVFGKFLLKRRLRKRLKKKISWLRSKRFRYRYRRRRYVKYWYSKILIVKMIFQWKKFMEIFKKLLKVFILNIELKKYKKNVILMDYVLKIKKLYKTTPFLFRSFMSYFRLFWSKFLKGAPKRVFNKKMLKLNTTPKSKNTRIKVKPKLLQITKSRTKKFKVRKSSRALILLFLKFQIFLKNIRNLLGEIKEAYCGYIGHLNLMRLNEVNLNNEDAILNFKEKYNLTDLIKIEKKEKIEYSYKNRHHREDGNEASSEEEELPLTPDELKGYLQQKWIKFLSIYPIVAKKRIELYKNLDQAYMHFYLRSLMKKFKKRTRLYYDKVKKKKLVRATALTYLLINSRHKQRRKRQITRFKKIHWFIPKYIHFDVRTLRGTLMYVPRANEIILPFKCSLVKIISFYKSLGV